MKKILFVSYNFPPAGTGAVMRITKFIKYLPSYGWHSVVVTPRQKGDVTDYTLFREIERYYTIYYTKVDLITTIRNRHIQKKINVKNKPYKKGGSNFHFLKKIYDLFEDIFLFPDKQTLWKKHAIKTTQLAIKKERPDVLLTTAPPFSSILVGLRIKEKNDLPWIVDFRDGWVGNPISESRFWFKKYFEKKAEKKIIEHADGILCATQHIYSSLVQRYSKFKNKIHFISNGYDPDDFKSSVSYIKKPELHIVYTGSFGAHRSPMVFLNAFKKAASESSEFQKDAVLDFIGNLTIDKKHWKQQLNNMITFSNYIPHKECIDIMKAADVLLLLLHTNEDNKAAFTGKLPEYLAAQRPIFALINEGTVYDLIIKQKLGYTANPSDINNITQVLLKIHKDWKYNQTTFNGLSIEFLRQFNRQELTKKLSRIANALITT